MVSRNRRKTWLLGVGLDNQDGHVRITHGEDFHLYGGSEDTHARMQETAIKINEKLAGRGKSLQNASPTDLREIAREVGLAPRPGES